MFVFIIVVLFCVFAYLSKIAHIHGSSEDYMSKIVLLFGYSSFYFYFLHGLIMLIKFHLQSVRGMDIIVETDFFLSFFFFPLSNSQALSRMAQTFETVYHNSIVYTVLIFCQEIKEMKQKLWVYIQS